MPPRLCRRSSARRGERPPHPTPLSTFRDSCVLFLLLLAPPDSPLIRPRSSSPPQILPLLRCVSLRSCFIGNHGAMALAEAIAAAGRASRLRRLNVSVNGLNDQGMEALKWAAAVAVTDGLAPMALHMEGNNDFAEACLKKNTP